MGEVVHAGLPAVVTASLRVSAALGAAALGGRTLRSPTLGPAGRGRPRRLGAVDAATRATTLSGTTAGGRGSLSGTTTGGWASLGRTGGRLSRTSTAGLSTLRRTGGRLTRTDRWLTTLGGPAGRLTGTGGGLTGTGGGLTGTGGLGRSRRLTGLTRTDRLT